MGADYDAEKYPLTYVYLGVRMSTRNEKIYCYADVSALVNDGRSLAEQTTNPATPVSVSKFNKQLKKHLLIGDTFPAAETREDGGVVTSSPGGVRGDRWRCRADLIEWQALTKAAETSAAVVSRAKADKYAELNATLKGLQSAYYQTPAMDRAAFLAMVIQGVTGSSSRK